jgi:hypothetical protein
LTSERTDYRNEVVFGFAKDGASVPQHLSPNYNDDHSDFYEARHPQKADSDRVISHFIAELEKHQYNFFRSFSPSISTLTTRNPFIAPFGVKLASSSNELRANFSGRKDAWPRTLIESFKQSPVMLLTHSQVFPSVSSSSDLARRHC